MSNKPFRIFIGFDPREYAAFAVAKESIRQFDRHVLINGLVLSDLQERGLYTRPTTMRLGKLWDEISGAHMSTEFANSRFLIPEIVRRQTMDWSPGGWALFMDCDVMARVNLSGPGQLREQLDDDKAVMCVKHDHQPFGNIKMDGQEQTAYPRKNWSSVMAINCDHDANKLLTMELVNSRPGRDLHAMCWLKDEDIGELGPEWNWIPGVSDSAVVPKLVHWSEGGPWFENFKNVPYADEWRYHLTRLAR
jgi:hypothetical protein